MSSVGKNSGAMVYGVVQYDFNAERPDELEAKAGEAIVVIAQSNPEWFVAKPIGRLGGPGLIPVSFIEIRDVATQEPVPDAQAAVARAGVPKVEEWKKMARDYKESSISLGKIEAASAQRETSRTSLNNGNQPYNYSNGSSQVSLLVVFEDLLTLITNLIEPSLSSKKRQPFHTERNQPSIIAQPFSSCIRLNTTILFRER